MDIIFIITHTLMLISFIGVIYLAAIAENNQLLNAAKTKLAETLPKITAANKSLTLKTDTLKDDPELYKQKLENAGITIVRPKSVVLDFV